MYANFVRGPFVRRRGKPCGKLNMNGGAHQLYTGHGDMSKYFLNKQKRTGQRHIQGFHKKKTNMFLKSN